MTDDAEAVSSTLVRHRLSLSPVTIEPERRPADEHHAYALQAQVNAELSARGLGHVSGLKIGCTTPVMQKFLGIPSPCAGEVFSATVMHGKGTVRHDAYRRIGVECEIVAILGEDMRPSDAPFTASSVARSVAALAPGIEIVDDRYADYRTLGVHTLIADNFFNAGCVLGKPVTEWQALPLPELGGRMLINGNEVGRGRGAMVLGHPLEALAWLANLKASQGLTIPKGAFVFLGSLVETKWLQPGDAVRIDIDALGSAELSVT